jgi:Lrp/AsnC family transcriptional regulator, leucine-responsive regulatory protein
MDAIDRHILRELQADGRLTNQELADRVGLSPSPCLRRVRRLERDGVIAGYRAIVAPALVGLGQVVFASVRLERETTETIEAFERAVADVPEVLECHSVLGPTDHLLRIAVRDLDDYRRLYIERLARLPGVAQIESQVAFRAIKQAAALPL